MHGDDALEAGLGTDELYIVRPSLMIGLGPLQSQLVERVACFREFVALTRQRLIQPGNPLRAMSQHVTIDRISAPERVDQPGPAGPNETHRHLDPGLVERRYGTNEDLAPAL